MDTVIYWAQLRELKHKETIRQKKLTNKILLFSLKQSSKSDALKIQLS